MLRIDFTAANLFEETELLYLEQLSPNCPGVTPRPNHYAGAQTSISPGEWIWLKSALPARHCAACAEDPDGTRDQTVLDGC